MLVERLVRSRRRAYLRVKSPFTRPATGVWRETGWLVGQGALALLVTMVFVVWGYLLIALGLHPESIDAALRWAPGLALFWLSFRAGARAARHGLEGGWAGLCLAGVLVVLWLAVWLYLEGRFSPWAWFREGLGNLMAPHLKAWFLALLLGGAGGLLGACRFPCRGLGWGTLGLCFALLSAAMFRSSHFWETKAYGAAREIDLECGTPAADGTMVRLFRFDFATNPDLRLEMYDADFDDATPLDDGNSSHMGQGIDLVGNKLERKLAWEERRLLCVFNAGFFGYHGNRLAHHEAPVVEDGRAHYLVDLIRPKEQAWVFAMRAPEQVEDGKPRFALRPEVEAGQLENYQTLLAGVRPLRVQGKSVPLAPGIGSTSLKCSRTSLGWSESGNEFFVLVVRDPDSEGASSLQRRAGIPQSGGWDVREVQDFWEKRGVPNAILLDGGESSQAAYRLADGSLAFLRGGYHAALPLGHWNERPILAVPAMWPALQNCRGVLNYLYVDGSKE